MSIYPRKVRVPDIDFPHKFKINPTASTAYWNNERGKEITVGEPIKVKDAPYGYEVHEGCDTEYLWPVLEDNGVVRHSSILYLACCHVIDIGD